MKKILEKVARFVELSKEFTKYEDEIYEGFQIPLSYEYLVSSNTGTINFSNIPNPEYGTKQQEYKKFLNEKIEAVDRWEEYKTLQADLSEYFNSVNKLNK
jgi:hypothetical protein